MVPPTGFPELPFELIFQICDLLDLEDILVARFLLRQFAAAGLERVIQHQIFALVPKNVAKFEAIARDPISGSLVRSLNYEMDTLKRLPTKTSEQNHQQWSVDVSSEDFNYANLLRRYQSRGWGCGDDVREFQTKLADNDGECRSMERRNIYKKVLKGLPNLKEIRLVSATVYKLFGPDGNNPYGTFMIRYYGKELGISLHGSDQLEDIL